MISSRKKLNLIFNLILIFILAGSCYSPFYYAPFCSQKVVLLSVFLTSDEGIPSFRKPRLVYE